MLVISADILDDLLDGGSKFISLTKVRTVKDGILQLRRGTLKFGSGIGLRLPVGPALS